MAPQLAWLGLGNMGKGICENLISKGPLDKPLILWNRTPSKATSFSSTLEAGKSTVASSIRDAVLPADIIMQCLGDDASVESTISTILENDVKGKLIVDCSTIHPDTTAAIEKRVTDAGAEFVAMPVFGAPAAAAAGQLICVLAGPSSSISKLHPYTVNVIGKSEILFADEPASKATLLKVIGNTFIINMIESLSEGHVLAEKCGLSQDQLHSFISALFPGPYTGYSRRMIDGDYYDREPLFHVDLARKDVRHALALAKETGTQMPALEVGQRHLDEVRRLTDGKGDLPGVYGAVRVESGLGYGNKKEEK